MRPAGGRFGTSSRLAFVAQDASCPAGTEHRDHQREFRGRDTRQHERRNQAQKPEAFRQIQGSLVTP